MPKRLCDSCGKEKDLSGGKVCSKGHFVCKEDYYRIVLHGKCPLCGEPLR